MGRDTLEETWGEKWRRECLPKLREFDLKRKDTAKAHAAAEKHREFASRDMVKQIKWRGKTSKTIGNRVNVFICNILLDKYL